MRILIDFTPIPLERTGVGVYAENLIREMVPILCPGDTLFLLVQDDERTVSEIVRNAGNIRTISIPSALFRNRLALMIYEQCVLPWVLLAKRIDVIHSLHYMHPILTPSVRVVTVHDLTHSLKPQFHTRSRRLLMPIFAKRAVTRAEAVIFVSRSTLNDAERLWSKQNNLRRVIPLGIGSEAFLRDSDELTHEMLQRLNVRQPYILFVGTIEPRKNLIRLISAFCQIASAHPACDLVIAGMLGWGFQPVLDAISSSPFRERIRYVGYLSEIDKRALIEGCKVLAYPSLYEGFGLPVLEGMAAGVPVVTSNVSSLPEVAGDAAMMVDPYSVNEIASAIDKLLSSSALAAKLRSAGPRQAQEFSWTRTASDTYELYRAVFSREKRIASSTTPRSH